LADGAEEPTTVTQSSPQAANGGEEPTTVTQSSPQAANGVQEPTTATQSSPQAANGAQGPITVTRSSPQATNVVTEQQPKLVRKRRRTANDPVEWVLAKVTKKQITAPKETTLKQATASTEPTQKTSYWKRKRGEQDDKLCPVRRQMLEKMYKDPYCEWCKSRTGNVKETREHILVECPAIRPRIQRDLFGLGDEPRIGGMLGLMPRSIVSVLETKKTPRWAAKDVEAGQAERSPDQARRIRLGNARGLPLVNTHHQSLC